MKKDELTKYLKQFTSRYRVTEYYIFLLIEVSSKKHLDLINSIIADKKQLGIIHKTVKLKWYQCWFPKNQWISIDLIHPN